MDYQDYLASKEWKAKSKAAKEKAGRQCQLCSSEENLNTHHRTYDNIGHEDPKDLIVLCRECHKEFHKKLKVCKKKHERKSGLSQFEISTRLLRRSAKELGLTQTERLVLVQMSEAHPNIRITHKTLAAYIGCSTKTIQRNIQILLDKKYLICTKQFSREENRPAEYRMNLDNIG